MNLVVPGHMQARLAQSVEHGTLNPGVVGSSPTLGAIFYGFMQFEKNVSNPSGGGKSHDLPK